MIREFDGNALYAALDAKRRAEGLSWPGAAAAIWDMAPTLSRARDERGLPNHPISPSTLQNLAARAGARAAHQSEDPRDATEMTLAMRITQWLGLPRSRLHLPGSLVILAGRIRPRSRQ